MKHLKKKMPLPTTSQVFDYVRKNPGCSSKEIASKFHCEVSDINRSREIDDFIGVYENPEIRNIDYKHYDNDVQKDLESEPDLGLLRKEQIKSVMNKYLDISKDKNINISLDPMYGELNDLLKSWNPPPAPPQRLYVFVFFSFMLFMVSAYINTEKMMITLNQYHDGVSNVTEESYQYIFYLQSNFVQSCQELWRGQIFGNISIV